MGLPVSITAGTRDSAPAALRFADLPADVAEGRLQGAFLTPTSGGAAGQRLMITGVLDGLVMLGFGGMSIPVLETIRVGDTVEIDNSDYLAAQTYHRHQDPGPEYPVWDQFKAPDGSHLYPVRPLLKGYDQVGEGNSWQSGNFDCKVISVNCLHGRGGVPVAGRLVPPAGDGQLRARVPRPLPPVVRRPGDAREPEPLPVAQRGLRATPRPRPDRHPDRRPTRACSTRRCAMSRRGPSVASNLPGRRPTDVVDGQIEVPPTAAERGGVQPVVTLTVNGGDRADVAVGEPVELVGDVEVPPAAGVVVSAEWDYDGSGTYADVDDVTERADGTTVDDARTPSTSPARGS